jgi:hypothetical protein
LEVLTFTWWKDYGKILGKGKSKKKKEEKDRNRIVYSNNQKMVEKPP